MFRKTGRMHQVTRNIDRRGDRYYEHIEDAETGEVIRHKDEPLSEHVAERDLRRRGARGSTSVPDRERSEEVPRLDEPERRLGEPDPNHGQTGGA